MRLQAARRLGHGGRDFGIHQGSPSRVSVPAALISVETPNCSYVTAGTSRRLVRRFLPSIGSARRKI